MNAASCRFENNHASGNGAAMYLLGHVNLVQDEDSTVVFQGNKAGGGGGAIYAEELPVVPEDTIVPLSISIKSAEFDGNEAARFGGAICLVGGTLDLAEQIKFAGNEIPDDEKFLPPISVAVPLLWCHIKGLCQFDCKEQDL